MSYQSGMDAFKAGNYQEAADAFRECVESDEDNHKAWNSLGVVYTKTGHYEAADTCYENALSLAPGTAAYERNRDKNKAKIVEPVEDILSVEDDDPKDWKIPGPEDKPKPAAKPDSTSASAAKTPQQYTIKQYAIAGVALIFLILIGGACMSMIGGGGQYTSDDKEFIEIATEFSKKALIISEEQATDATNQNYDALKKSAQEGDEYSSTVLVRIEPLKVSGKLKPIFSTFKDAVGEFQLSCRRAYQAVESIEQGGTGYAGFTAAIEHTEKYTALIKQLTEQLKQL